jgi:hypothetical protein
LDENRNKTKNPEDWLNRGSGYSFINVTHFNVAFVLYILYCFIF